MKWVEIGIHTTNDAVEAISNILHEAGASGVVIEDPLELIKERADQFGEIYQLDPKDYPDEGVMIKAYLTETSFLHETVEEIKAKVKNEKKKEYEINEEIQNEIKKLEEEFKDNGRVLIRPSGTEPLIRVMIEGENQEYKEKKAKELAEYIEKKLG